MVFETIHTPHEEISWIKESLAETELSLSEIAERTGFRHVEYLSATFKKKAGLPPSKYRAQNQK